MTIVQYPSEVLKRRSNEVKTLDFQDEELIAFTGMMLEEFSRSGGVGLAAPQVGYSLRIIIVDEHAGTELSSPEVMLNPRISKTSKKFERFIEACLSLPGRRFAVSRAKSLWYTYTTVDGDHRMAYADGFKAQIIQHEVDHINGITIADRGREVL